MSNILKIENIHTMKKKKRCRIRQGDKMRKKYLESLGHFRRKDRSVIEAKTDNYEPHDELELKSSFYHSDGNCFWRKIIQ